MFEEDVIGNVRTAITMAPECCTQCGDFHMSWVLRRFDQVDPKEWDGFREGIALGISEALKDGRRPAILIAGAADTGILKSVVDAAYLAGGDAAVREIDVTVIDICETPLQMCRNYAAQHGINVVTERTDIGSYAPGSRYDVIAFHEVLAFFPEDQRLSFMKGIVSWARPGGLIVSWSLVSPPNRDGDEQQKRIAGKLKALDAFFAGEGRDLAAFAEDARARAQRGTTAKPRNRPFPEPGDVAAFHRSADLEIVQELVMDRTARKADEPRRQCVVIVARTA